MSSTASSAAATEPAPVESLAKPDMSVSTPMVIVSDLMAAWAVPPISIAAQATAENILIRFTP